MHFKRDVEVQRAQDVYTDSVDDEHHNDDDDHKEHVHTEQDVGLGQDNYDDEDDEQQRPHTYRSTSEPSPAMMLQSYFTLNSAKALRRNRSPLSRSHLRSRSSGSALAPAMVRAHSMPAVHSLARSYDLTSAASLSTNAGAGHSPQRSPARNKSPLAAENVEQSYFPPRSPRLFENGGPFESIQEDSELDLTPRHSTAYSPVLPNPPPITLSSRTGSMRRRPVSPLYSSASPAFGPVEQDSPALAPTKLSDSSFHLHHYSSIGSFSSISSTPSSARSRSPSISSLETIEDAPDAEYEAIEADRLWRMSLSDKSDREEASDDGLRRKGFGFSRGRNSERKRWSVCGGERRADLDLETIWED